MQPKEVSLLLIFDAIMTEGSITRAADRLALTQPAVSNAVARMRDRWKDDLFVRDGKQIRATSFAENLWQQIRNPLRDLKTAITLEAFDPATSNRTFRICAVPDASVDSALRKLREIVEAEAPGIKVYTFPYHEDEAESILVSDRVDMVVGAMQPLGNMICTEPLFVPKYVCVMRPDHPLARKPLTMEGFSSADHLMVSFMSCEVSDLTDQALARHGLSRRIPMTVHHFGAVPEVICNSNLIAVVPSTAVEREIFAGELAVSVLPVEVTPTPIAVMWHKRQELDQGLTWLRGNVSQLIAEYAKEHSSELRDALKTHRSAPRVAAITESGSVLKGRSRQL